MNKKKVNKLISSAVTAAYLTNTAPVMAYENIVNKDSAININDTEDNIQSTESDLADQDNFDEEVDNGKDKNSNKDNSGAVDNENRPSEENDKTNNENEKDDNKEDDNETEISEDKKEPDDNLGADINKSEEGFLEDNTNSPSNGENNAYEEEHTASVQKIRAISLYEKPTIEYKNNKVTLIDNGVFSDTIDIVETFDDPNDLKFNLSNNNWIISNGKLISNITSEYVRTTTNSMTIDLSTAATLTIRLRVSANEEGHYGRIYLNNTEVFKSTGYNKNFTELKLHLNSGINTIKFEYAKSYYGAEYEDALIIDEIALSSGTKTLHDKLQYRLDGGEWIDYTAPFDYNGGHTVEARGVKDDNYSEVATLKAEFANIPDEKLKQALNKKIGNTDLNAEIPIYKINEINGKLDISDLGIEDLTGLEHLTNVFTLYIDDSNIKSLEPIKDLTQLTYFSIDGSTLDNADDINLLYNLKELRGLYIRQNPITSEQFYKFGELEHLNTFFVGIVDKDSSIVLDDTNRNLFKELKTLRLDGGNIKGIDINGHDNIDTVYIYETNISDTAYIESESLTTVYMWEGYLNKIILNSVNSIEWISADDINIGDFELRNSNIKENMDIYIDYSNVINTLKISNITFDDGFNLRISDGIFNNTEITNVNGTLSWGDKVYIQNAICKNVFIDNMDTEVVKVDNSSIDSLTVKNSPVITKVFGEYGIPDLEYSPQLPKGSSQKSLDIQNCSGVSNVELPGFGFDNVNISDLSALSTVDLSENNIKDLVNLNTEKVTNLNLSSNGISDISKIKDCTVLETVNLDNNQITDFSPLKNIATLDKRNSVFGTQNVRLETVYANKGDATIISPIVKDLDENVIVPNSITNNGILKGDLITWTGYGEGLFEETVTFDIAPLSATVNIIQPISVDKTVPELNVITDETEWTNKNVTLTIKAIDSNSGVDYIELQDGTKVYSSEATVKIDENDTYSFKTYDKAGNVATKTVIISNIDKEKSIASSSVIYNSNKTEAIIKVDAKDTLSGIQSIINPDGKVIKDSSISFIVKTNGSYEFKIIDNAGNEIIEKITVNKITVNNPDENTSNNNSLNNPNNETEEMPQTGGLSNILFISYITSFVAGILSLRKRK